MKIINYLLDSTLAAFKFRWKVFLATLIAQFIITLLLNLGIKAPQTLKAFILPQTKVSQSQIISPLPNQTNIWDQLRVKLEEKQNSFEVKREGGWVPRVWAASSVDYEGASSYIVIDYDIGKILAEKKADERLPIASLTKIMTAVVALDLASPDEYFTVSKKASLIIPTKIGVVPGQRMSLEELLNALMLTSANDAAGVIREGIDQRYGQEVFIQAMNEKAKVLGLKNSSFANPQGFDDLKNYSSAADLAVLSRYALENYPQIREIVKKDYQNLPANTFHKQFDLYNWNGLIGVYPGAFGVKIGNTGQAGVTTVVAAERPSSADSASIVTSAKEAATEGKDVKRVLVVVLGAPGVLERDIWSSQLLDLGFEKLGIEPVGVTEAQLQQKYSTWKYWG